MNSEPASAGGTALCRPYGARAFIKRVSQGLLAPHHAQNRRVMGTPQSRPGLTSVPPSGLGLRQFACQLESHNVGGKRKSCAVPGNSLSFFTPPTVQPPQPAQHRRGLGTPVKRWAIIFRARGARVVPVLPSTRVPQAEKQIPPLGLKPSLGMTAGGPSAQPQASFAWVGPRLQPHERETGKSGVVETIVKREQAIPARGSMSAD